MLGRPAIWEPVCKKVMAGSWLIASVWRERMMQSSSASFAVCGKSSLIQAPLSPCRVKLKMLGAVAKLLWADDILVFRSSG